MDEALKLESEKLARSWLQHEPAKLRDYLVAGVEDPRINVQSIFSRHFLIRAIFDQNFSALMDEELRFAAVMNWLTALAANSDSEELHAVLHALQRGADNAEGLQIPRFILSTFTPLPLSLGPLEIPNYIETFLNNPPFPMRWGRAGQCPPPNPGPPYPLPKPSGVKPSLPNPPPPRPFPSSNLPVA